MPANTPSPGFTLVELMVTLAVLAILSTLAAPMFGDLIQRSKVDAASGELAHLLQYARSEAITRASAVTITASSGNWVGALSVATSSETLRQYGSEGINGGSAVTATGSASSLTFRAAGTLNGAAQSIRLCPSSGSSGRLLSISSSGQITSTTTECSS
ncbi:GspH/FimT family pseudopilin [Pseudomonas sp. BGr12]|uniref:GspH/FimT family pseudopilin n=1 Tax=unclassified Pseudomonas TaxID=196821 RepID=UPI00177FB7AB|nr:MULTISPECIES: GspH/FimT family pseudopilin [unclassified Pseudomonas]MBD9499202.1 GspH/FimT family pseudopilin [Pseudomonas sp. PDM17]MBD9576065.1 GspH/FimT family pseudopilin [Pseudomonas sp. PDM23]MBD9668990.1 GspH/FimT family pseudopilin [Pseudomonas sp. PDM21]MDL2426358.1 GspH/FimT family pseudopilin [Pseudomonas sp. BJa5]